MVSTSDRAVMQCVSVLRALSNSPMTAIEIGRVTGIGWRGIARVVRSIRLAGVDIHADGYPSVYSLPSDWIAAVVPYQEIDTRLPHSRYKKKKDKRPSYEISNAFVADLNAAMKAKEISITAIADALGLSYASVYQLVSGRLRYSSHGLAIAKHVGIASPAVGRWKTGVQK